MTIKAVRNDSGTGLHGSHGFRFNAYSSARRRPPGQHMVAVDTDEAVVGRQKTCMLPCVQGGLNLSVRIR